MTKMKQQDCDKMNKRKDVRMTKSTRGEEFFPVEWCQFCIYKNYKV